MKLHQFKRLLSLLLVAALLAGFYVPTAQAASTGFSWKETDKEIRTDMTDRVAETQVEEKHSPSDIVRISIVLEDKPTIQAGYGTRNIVGNAEAMSYNSQLKAKQDALAQAISTQALNGQKLDVVWNLTLAANLISANVPYGKISAISQVEGVKAVILENTYTPCVIEREENVAEPQMFASLGMTGSSLLWSSGYTGAGSRIAVLDTGTDTNHQSLDSGAYLYALEQNAAAAGMTFDEYVATLDLLDAQEIASVLPYLNFKQLYPNVTADKLYLNEKLPFAANYIDGNLVVDHESDGQGEHGSHVAGISTANRFIPQGEGYADALTTVMMAGVAPDAQLITMKVFGASGGPADSDYMAAVEDAIYLGCDSVNLSLGSSVSDFGFNAYFAELLEYMTQTDTVVVASAGNAYSWPETTMFGRPYTGDVAMDTIGSPGSYSSFFTVASVENDGGVGLVFQIGNRSFSYTDGSNAYNNPLTVLDTSDDLSGTTYEYVFIDGLGYAADYAGMDLEGKVVFCSRGESSFYVKAETAVELGAVATIVYNNQAGLFGMNLAGYSYYNPCASITQSDANVIRAASTAHVTDGGITYYTGEITVLGKETGYVTNSDYYTMSDFSSWGVPGDLSLKPEITAPGGNIYSLNGESAYGGGPDQYELMSGTSMAAPAVTGMAALIAQYLRETGLAEEQGMHVRTLTQSLLMSTAVPILEEVSGSYYSLLKQGAGLARPDLAAAADSYILVEGQPDGKVKAELGDDPERTGVYEFTFTITNITDKTQSYNLRADVFRQDAYDPGLASGTQAYGFMVMDQSTTLLPATATFTVDGMQVEPDIDLWEADLNGDSIVSGQDADYLLEYLLGNKTTLYGDGDINGDGKVNTYDAHVLLSRLNSSGSSVMVASGETVTVSVRIALTDGAKSTLDETFENGTYVEAYVYAESEADAEGTAGTVHSIPVLAFYGNWSDPNMFDYGTIVELMSGNYVGMVPYMYQMISTGSANSLTVNYGDGGEYYFGGNPYLQDDVYLAERNAFNSENASTIHGQYFTLIRNASDLRMVITNAETGEVYHEQALGRCYPAYYFVNYGTWEYVQQGFYVGWKGTDANGNALPEDTLVNASLIAVPEYYRNEDGTHNFEALGQGIDLTTQFYIDNTAPEVTDMKLEGTTLTIDGLDNRYVAAVILTNASGSSIIAAETPNQTELNAPITVELDLENVLGKTFLLGIYDYADNYTVYEISLELPEVERPYFTVVDYTESTYYGLNADGSAITLAVGDRGLITAAEFLDGYVFEAVQGGDLYVASNDDLNNFRYLGNLDPNKEYGITNVVDMAFNYADDTLYGLFYCELNSEEAPVLFTLDPFTGTMEVLGLMPMDVHNLAIDGEGNFYSVAYYTNQLYTYTLEGLYNGEMNFVGEISYYLTGNFNSLSWDHNTDKLYWAYPNTLLEVDPETAEPTLLHYNNYMMVGLYIVPETYGDRFAPTSNVGSVTLNHTENRTLVDSTVTLTAQVWPWNVTDDSVVWSSSDTSVATVDGNGTVTGIAPGTAIITAASRLDPTKSAECVFTVEKLEKTLNGIVWDEEGQIWWSEFNTATIPSYTKLTDTPAEDYIASTALMPDGTLYVSTSDASSDSFSSNVYTVDPETFELTYVGTSSAGYVDIAPAPHIRGGALAAVYGGNVLFVDTSTGDFYQGDGDIFYMFQYNLVGIAYAGSLYYNDYGFDNYIDWYFLIDSAGFVYYMGWIEGPDGRLYYLEHPEATGGIYTVINAESDTPYFSSAYYDGEFLFYSCYNEKRDNNTLYAIDTMGDHKAYELGNFGAGVWPVGGLMELSTAASADLQNVTVTAEPKALEGTYELTKLAVDTKETVSDGSLNSIVPASSGDYHEMPNLVVLELAGVETAPNGLMTVTYDPTVLQFASIAGYAEAFAYTVEDGKITIAFANASEQPKDTCIAILSFAPLKSGQHTITVEHKEAGNAASDVKETVTVEVPAAEEEYTMKWVSVSTTLTGNIGLNFYAELSENLVNNPDAFVRFTLNGKTTDVPVSQAVQSVSNGTTRYRFTCPITAKNMTDVVSAQVMVGDEAVGSVKTMDVATYCNWVIENYTDADTVNLMKAMLNYGASAQLLFGHNTDDLANAKLSEADKVLADVDASAYKHSVAGTEEGIEVTSMTLLLDSETTIRVYFTLTGSKTIDQYTFRVNGKEVTAVEKDGKYYVQIPNIPAHRLSEMYQVTVGGITVTYGALSYVNQVMNFAAATPETVNMAKALFAYYEAAMAYAN